MSKLFTAQGITAILTAIATVLALFGKDQLSAFFTDPGTVQTILGIAAIFGIGGQALLPAVTDDTKKE